MSFNTARSIFVQSLQSAARELKGVRGGGRGGLILQMSFKLWDVLECVDSGNLNPQGCV